MHNKDWANSTIYTSQNKESLPMLLIQVTIGLMNPSVHDKPPSLGQAVQKVSFKSPTSLLLVFYKSHIWVICQGSLFNVYGSWGKCQGVGVLVKGSWCSGHGKQVHR